ncbi:MAG TPA: threonine/serine dehydratase [Candidatus Baltobacteraceae bacterium]|nr:threonine/serine dehydratase [Candidatus Baltobacteraceae bacterium]
METAQTAPIDRSAISTTRDAIAPYVRKTPIVEAYPLDFGFDGGTAKLAFKLELLQHSGSFKARGAFANLLMRTVPAAGVTAASGGNHGAAVAYAAMRLGHRAKIFVPSVSSAAKVARIRQYGAELVVTGDRYGDTVEACREWGVESGALNVHAFDQTETLLGTGTLGLEIGEQLPDVDTILVPVGGGGLIAGIAAWFAGTPVRVVGVEPEGAPTLTAALAAGIPVDAPAGSVANDSLAPARIGDLVFPIVQRHVERVVLVSDDDIVRTQQRLWNGLTIVAEPGGAAAFAAVLSGRYVAQPDERICIVVSGGNSSAVDFR